MTQACQGKSEIHPSPPAALKPRRALPASGQAQRGSFLPEGRESGHSGKPATLRVDFPHRNNAGRPA